MLQFLFTASLRRSAHLSDSLYIEDLNNCLNSVVNLDGLRGKTVLITGATGMIGSFIADALTQLIVGVCTGLVVYILLSLVICKREFNYVVSLLKRK